MSRERAAIIAGIFVCLAAVIGLGSPIVDRLADKYFPTVTPTTVALQATSTVTITSPTSIPTEIPTSTPTKLSINSLNRLALLTFFEIPRETLTDVDRLDNIFRPNRSGSLVVIPNYPLLPQYALDDFGYLFENGKEVDISPGTDIGKYLDIDWEKWANYLGIFDFVIPTDKNLQFCGFYIRSEGGGLNWESSQRFIYSADIGVNDFKIERASWVEIKDCSDTPIANWSRKQAETAYAPTDSVYYWDKETNEWVKLK